MVVDPPQKGRLFKYVQCCDAVSRCVTLTECMKTRDVIAASLLETLCDTRLTNSLRLAIVLSNRLGVLAVSNM